MTISAPSTTSSRWRFPLAQWSENEFLVHVTIICGRFACVTAFMQKNKNFIIYAFFSSGDLFSFAHCLVLCAYDFLLVRAALFCISMVRKDARVGFPRLKFSALVKPRLLPSIIAYQAERKGKSRVVASGGPVMSGPPIWSRCTPFHVWPLGCCIHPILYFKNVPPPCCWILATGLGQRCEFWLCGT